MVPLKTAATCWDEIESLKSSRLKLKKETENLNKLSSSFEELEKKVSEISHSRLKNSKMRFKI